MNIFQRIGDYWERRRIIRYTEFKIWMEALEAERKELDKKYDGLRSLHDKHFSEALAIPQTIAKELALIKARIDRLELLTGLKRDPEAVHVKGAPKIA